MSSPLIAALSTRDVDTLLDLIKANPTWEFVNQIAYGFRDIAQSQPRDVDKIANAILSIRATPCGLPEIDTTDSIRQPIKAKFANILAQCLLDMLKSALGVTMTSKSTPKFHSSSLP
jgi:hypothetical protein